MWEKEGRTKRSMVIPEKDCAPGSSKSGVASALPSIDIVYYHGVFVIQFKDELRKTCDYTH